MCDPKVMAESKSETKGSIFMVCPIGARDSDQRKRSDQIKRHVIEPAFPDHEVRRSDLMSEGGSISHQIVSAIQNAALVVVDMTGLNPNVFYEMAIAHGYRRPVVHMIQDGERIPFDVKDMRTLEYDLSDPDRVVEARESMEKLGNSAMNAPGDIRTPISQADAFSSVSTPSNPETMLLSALSDQVAELSAQVQRLLWRGDVRTVGTSQSLPREKLLETREQLRLLSAGPYSDEIQRQARTLESQILSEEDPKRAAMLIRRADRLRGFADAEGRSMDRYRKGREASMEGPRI